MKSQTRDWLYRRDEKNWHELTNRFSAAAGKPKCRREASGITGSDEVECGATLRFARSALIQNRDHVEAHK